MMHHLAGIEELHRKTRGDLRVVIAILDGPVDFSHPSLTGAVIDDLSLASEQRCHAQRCFGAAAAHGTHVCSIIFGRGAYGVEGIAPNCRGIIIPIFRDAESGGAVVPSSQIDLAVAIDRAVAAGANIINISGGQNSLHGEIHPFLKRAIDQAIRAGVLVVSATGNDACRCHHIPSSHPSVLAVGAHGRNGQPLESSNWGEQYRQNGVVAVGEDILGAVPGGTRVASGTSFATPVASGVAALLMSCQLSRSAPPCGAQIRRVILQSAIGCFGANQPDVPLANRATKRTSAVESNSPPVACQKLLAGKLNPIGAYDLLFEGTLRMAHDSDNSQHDLPAEAIDPAAIEPNLAELTPAPPANAPHLLPSSAPSSEILDATTPPVAAARDSQTGDSTAAGINDSPGANQTGIEPTGCGCGCSQPSQLVYVLGRIGYDFATEARLDSFKQFMSPPKANEEANPLEPQQFIEHIKSNPWDASSVNWTVLLNEVPIYAIRPEGAYAAETYQRLLACLEDQVSQEQAERIAVPGRIVGQATLYNGQTVPEIQPELRGIRNWTTDRLVELATQDIQPAPRGRKKTQLKESLTKFLNKLYNEHQNLGITPQDRAINFAATNALNAANIIQNATEKELYFDTVEVEPSEISRPGAEAWVVKVYFFDPTVQIQSSRKMYRFAVDVSDVVPVTVGPTLSWHVR